MKIPSTPAKITIRHLDLASASACATFLLLQLSVYFTEATLRALSTCLGGPSFQG